MPFSFTKNYKLLLIILTIIAALFHFYNLNWGAPYHFHPDERNIASAISQLAYPSQMNPHFFAYGSLPIYVVYFTRLFINGLLQNNSASVSFEHAIMIGRFFSATLATLLIPLLFFVGKQLKDEKTGLFAAFLGTFSVGLIQFAHFGTFEIWLTFFSLALFWACLQSINRQMLLLIGFLLGVLVSIKISSLVLLPLPLLALLLNNLSHKIKNVPKKIVAITQAFALTSTQGLFLLSLAGLVYMMTNPFVFFDTEAFISSMKYESAVALGTLPVFYTEEFTRSIPVLFQLQNIYPFLLNPLITILFIPTLGYAVWQSSKKLLSLTKLTRQTKNELLLLTFFFILFLSQAFLFVKWTRYMVPTLPFIYLIFALVFFRIKWLNHIKTPLATLLCIVSATFSIAYSITAFVQPDTRITALHIAQTQLPSETKILTEVYDLGITPFNGIYPEISGFNFYDLDHASPDWTDSSLQNNIEQSDAIILPSQRILTSRTHNAKDYPKGHEFYTKLLQGKTTFQKIYETPCDIFCQITYLNNPIFQYEQTASVFERPVVIIFKKQ